MAVTGTVCTRSGPTSVCPRSSRSWTRPEAAHSPRGFLRNPLARIVAEPEVRLAASAAPSLQADLLDLSRNAFSGARGRWRWGGRRIACRRDVAAIIADSEVGLAASTAAGLQADFDEVAGVAAPRARAAVGRDLCAHADRFGFGVARSLGREGHFISTGHCQPA